MSPPAPSADSLPSGRRRWWRVGQNAGALVAARVVSGLCQLALIPLLLGLLGTRTFGWVMALVALVGLSQFADLGAAMALQQKLSEAWARGDAAGLRRTYASGVRLLLDLGLAWFIFAAPVAWWLGSRLLEGPMGAVVFWTALGLANRHLAELQADEAIPVADLQPALPADEVAASP